VAPTGDIPFSECLMRLKYCRANRPRAQEEEQMARKDERESIESADGPNIGLIIAGVVAVLLVVFMLQNTDEQEISFLLFEGTIPLWMALLLAAIGGAIVGQIGMWLWRRRGDE
jgi:uncharacterized integral membrane protein